MLYKIKTSLLFSISLLFLCLLLGDAKTATGFARNGLNAWFMKMIPTLFPFMVLGGILLRCGYSIRLTAMISPVLGPVFGLTRDCLYIMVMGFLCGFPMGAVLIEQSLSLSRITRDEANYLAAFCNNIGPVYFLGFVLQSCQMERKIPCLCVMYMVPFLYGLLLRHTVYRAAFLKNTGQIRRHPLHSMSFPEAFETSLEAAIESITKLGGYMILFNTLAIFFCNSYLHCPDIVNGILACLLEISGGIIQIRDMPMLYPFVYSMLPFGGLCCIAQAAGILKRSGLSVKSYVFHKLVQTAITACAYVFFF